MELIQTIARLTNATGVSGDEFGVSAIAAELLKPYVDRVEIDKLGNVTGYRSCGKPGAKTLMLDAHLDQIGFLITEVLDEGFCRFIGMGVDQRMLLGSQLTVLTKEGPIPAVVSCIPPHLQNPGDNKKSVPIEEMVLDLGMGGEQAKNTVRVGDYAAFSGEALPLKNDLLCGKSMDDRSCFVCILYALEMLEGEELDVDLVILGSTKEEVGGHGAQARAYVDKPDYAIAIDVCHAKTADSKPDDRVFDLGGGPVIGFGSNSIPRFARRLVEVARAKEIPHQVEAVPAHSGTNAWAIQTVESGVCTAVVSLPLKYMHSPVEVLKLSDVRQVARLLCEFVKSFDGNL